MAHDVDNAVQLNYRRLQTTIGRKKNKTNISLDYSDDEEELEDDHRDNNGSSHTLSPRASKSVLSNFNPGKTNSKD